MKIPFVDLQAQYQNIKLEIDGAMSSVMRDTAFVGGSGNKYIRKFESDFASYLHVKHVISCANGTDSLEILLEAFEIGKNHEVIIPAISWISTSESVGRAGAKPVFVDVCADTLLMDVNKVESQINENTKAIIPVHLYGNPVNMEAIMLLAKKHNLIVIEDCAQSHGATYRGKLVGTFGHAASYSFYPGKNLGAYGDAGAITTDNDTIATKCRMIANHGQLQKHTHVIEGRNSRMDGLHAAVLSVKLNYLNKWNSLRNEHAKTYAAKLAGSSVVLPVTNEHGTHVFHLFVVRTEQREQLKKHLEENGVETAIHYPQALPFIDAYKKFNYAAKDFPVAFAETKKILSIPMFPELTDGQINRVTGLILSFK